MDAVDHKNAEDRATGSQSRNEANDPNQKKNDPEDQSDGLINIRHGFLASFHFEHTDRKDFWITSPEYPHLAARLWRKSQTGRSAEEDASKSLRDTYPRRETWISRHLSALLLPKSGTLLSSLRNEECGIQ